MQNQKVDVIVYEPNLDLRKDLVKLLPISKYLLRLLSSIEEVKFEIKHRVPHLVIISLDEKKMEHVKEIKKLKAHLPKESVLVGMSSKEAHKGNLNFIEAGLSEIWSVPIEGLKIKPRINEISANLKPINVDFDTLVPLVCKIEGEVVAMGEAEFIAKFPLKMKQGDQLKVESDFLTEMLEGEEKSLIVTENRHEGVVDDQITVTILGLKNSNLKNIRSKVLNWEKL